MSASTKNRGRSGGSDTPDLLTYEQAAEYLNVSVHWLRRKRNKDAIGWVPVGRHVRFPKRYLDAFIVANLREPVDHFDWGR